MTFSVGKSIECEALRTARNAKNVTVKGGLLMKRALPDNSSRQYFTTRFYLERWETVSKTKKKRTIFNNRLSLPHPLSLSSLLHPLPSFPISTPWLIDAEFFLSNLMFTSTFPDPISPFFSVTWPLEPKEITNLNNFQRRKVKNFCAVSRFYFAIFFSKTSSLSLV